jgi:hypothetical protein
MEVGCVFRQDREASMERLPEQDHMDSQFADKRLFRNHV